MVERGASNGSRPPHRQRSSSAVRWGTWVAHHRWWVPSVWIVLASSAAVSYPHLLSSLGASDYSVTGSDSAQVARLTQEYFSAAGAEQDVIVFDSTTSTIHDPAYGASIWPPRS